MVGESGLGFVLSWRGPLVWALVGCHLDMLCVFLLLDLYVRLGTLKILFLVKNCVWIVCFLMFWKLSSGLGSSLVLSALRVVAWVRFLLEIDVVFAIRAFRVRCVF